MSEQKKNTNHSDYVFIDIKGRYSKNSLHPIIGLIAPVCTHNKNIISALRGLKVLINFNGAESNLNLENVSFLLKLAKYTTHIVCVMNAFQRGFLMVLRVV